jgi:hypothetical protein
LQYGTEPNKELSEDADVPWRRLVVGASTTGGVFFHLKDLIFILLKGRYYEKCKFVYCYVAFFNAS